MFEYKVVPAPMRAAKVKGLKSTAERFAHALAERINAEAGGGWQFQRTETLPCEERKGLGSMKASTQTVMIFSRLIEAVRPDAGAALAAAQEAQPVYYDEQMADNQAADNQAADNHAAHDAADPAPFHETEPYHEPYAEPEPYIETEPQVSPPVVPAAPVGRQEPLFRANPMIRPDAGARAEPVLRPRPARAEDDDAP